MEEQIVQCLSIISNPTINNDQVQAATRTLYGIPKDKEFFQILVRLLTSELSINIKVMVCYFLKSICKLQWMNIDEG